MNKFFITLLTCFVQAVHCIPNDHKCYLGLQIGATNTYGKFKGNRRNDSTSAIVFEEPELTDYENDKLRGVKVRSVCDILAHGEHGKPQLQLALHAGRIKSYKECYAIGGEAYIGFDTAKVTQSCYKNCTRSAEHAFADNPVIDFSDAEPVNLIKAVTGNMVDYRQSTPNLTCMKNNTLTIRRGLFTGLAVRAGYYLTDTALLYGRLGLEFGRWSVTERSTIPSKNTTQRKFCLSPVPGAGIEIFTGGKLSIRIDYRYVWGPAISAGDKSWKTRLSQHITAFSISRCCG